MKSQIKKIFAVLVCVCLMFSVVAISASAADATTEIVLTVDSLGLASNSYSASTKTVDGASFEWIQLGNYGDGIQVRDKNGNTSSLWNTAAFDKAIKEIKLVYSDSKDVTYANPDCAIYSFGNEAGTYTYTTKLSTAAGVKEYTITPDAQTYTFFKFEHDLGYTQYWKSITIVLADTQTGGGSVTPPPAGEGDEKAPEYELVEAPAAATAYKFGMIQGNVSATDVYYLKGGMNGYYMDTVADVASAIDVYLEETTGGYYLYTMVDNVKTYINMVVSGTHVNGAYEAAASTVYTFDATSKTITADVDGAPYWFGTRNDKTYTTVGPVKTEYQGFYCQFYAEKKAPVVDDEKDDDTTNKDETNKDETDKDTTVDTNKDNNADANNTTKPVPTTGESNSVVVTLMSIVALAVAATFVVTKFCKN